MVPANNDVKEREQKGLATTSLAGICHSCNICPYAAKRPDSSFDRLMRWHRTWCPAWAAHSKIYGVKALSH